MTPEEHLKLAKMRRTALNRGYAKKSRSHKLLENTLEDGSQTLAVCRMNVHR